MLHRIEASIRRLESAPKSDPVAFLSSLPHTVASTAESVYNNIVHVSRAAARASEGQQLRPSL